MCALPACPGRTPLPPDHLPPSNLGSAHPSSHLPTPPLPQFLPCLVCVPPCPLHYCIVPALVCLGFIVVVVCNIALAIAPCLTPLPPYLIPPCALCLPHGTPCSHLLPPSHYLGRRDRLRLERQWGGTVEWVDRWTGPRMDRTCLGVCSPVLPLDIPHLAQPVARWLVWTLLCVLFPVPISQTTLPSQLTQPHARTALCLCLIYLLCPIWFITCLPMADPCIVVVIAGISFKPYIALTPTHPHPIATFLVPDWLCACNPHTPQFPLLWPVQCPPLPPALPALALCCLPSCPFVGGRHVCSYCVCIVTPFALYPVPPYTPPLFAPFAPYTWLLYPLCPLPFPLALFGSPNMTLPYLIVTLGPGFGPARFVCPVLWVVVVTSSITILCPT